jgi:hypothetical protein
MATTTSTSTSTGHKHAGLNYVETDGSSREDHNKLDPFVPPATTVEGEIRGRYPKASGRDNDAEGHNE